MRLKTIIVTCSLLFGFTASAEELTKRSRFRPKANLIFGANSSILSSYNTDFTKTTRNEDIALSSTLSPNYDFYVGTYVSPNFRIEGHFGQRTVKNASKQYDIISSTNTKAGKAKYTITFESTFASVDFLWDVQPWDKSSSLLVGAGLAYSDFTVKDFNINGYAISDRLNTYSRYPYSRTNVRQDFDDHFHGETENPISLKVITAANFSIAKSLAISTRLDAYIGNSVRLYRSGLAYKSASLTTIDFKIGLEYLMN